MEGLGLHTGKLVHLIIAPAQENSGINFYRIDDVEGRTRKIPALYHYISEMRLCTKIANEEQVSISTIEHLMSALWACEVDNALVFVDASEIPIMDGSAAPFISSIKKAGIVAQRARRHTIYIKKPIKIKDGQRSIEISPYKGLSIDFMIDYNDATIGKQKHTFQSSENSFENEISSARTFGFKKDLQTLHAAGLAQGASLQNTVGIDESGIMNDGGLRFKDEFVRHKILDCIGDLYLAGTRIIGKIKAEGSGHSLNCQILHELFSCQKAYELI